VHKLNKVLSGVGTGQKNPTKRYICTVGPPMTHWDFLSTYLRKAKINVEKIWRRELELDNVLHETVLDY
jgi:hypothetical protein